MQLKVYVLTQLLYYLVSMVQTIKEVIFMADAVQLGATVNPEPKFEDQMETEESVEDETADTMDVDDARRKTGAGADDNKNTERLPLRTADDLNKDAQDD